MPGDRGQGEGWKKGDLILVVDILDEYTLRAKALKRPEPNSVNSR